MSQIKNHLVYKDEETGIKWEVDVEGTFLTENYGEDADGNRGVMKTFIDDVKFSDWMKNGEYIKEKDVPKNIVEYFTETAFTMEWE